MASLAEILVNIPVPVAILVKITVVLGVGWMFHFIMAKGNPRWRQLLWKCTFTGLLLIPALVPLNYFQVSITPSTELKKVDEPSLGLPYPAMEASNLHSPESTLTSESASIPESISHNHSQPSVSFKAWFYANIWMIFLLGWAVVTVLLLLRMLSVYLQVRKQINASLEAPKHLKELLDSVAKDLGCTQEIKLRCASDMPTPFLTGLHSPMIILPERMLHGEYESSMPAVFAHEVAHHQSRDLIWMTIVRWCKTVLWFHPLVWRLQNAYSQTCEEVCDAVAANYLGNTNSYSSTLAKLALDVIDRVSAMGGTPMARSAEILKRLQALKNRFYPQRLARRWLFLAIVSTAMILTLLGGFNLVYAESNTAKPAPRLQPSPKERSLGLIVVLDVNQPFHSYTRHSTGWRDWYRWMGADHLSEARGEIMVPVGQEAGLFLSEDAFSDLTPLLNLKPDDLYMLAYLGQADDDRPILSAKSMQMIVYLSGLKDLRLIGTRTQTGSMQYITKLQSLEMLHLPIGATDTDLSYVAQLKSLRRLYFNGNPFSSNRITNKGLSQYLSQMVQLEELTLYGNEIDDAGLACLAGLNELRYLSLRSGNFTDAGLVHVRKCSSLKHLDLMHLPITDAGLQALSGPPKLENLELFNTKVTDRGLVYLKSMPSLKNLNLRKREYNHQITDAGMDHLAEIQSLECLELPGGRITDKGLVPLSNLKNLKRLWISGEFSDVALQQLSQLTSLEDLYVSSPGRASISGKRDTTPP